MGRDRVYTPRVRLPVMEISKHHANIFCDLSTATGPDVQPDFFVTDTGSTHGTFVHRRPLESLPIRPDELSTLHNSDFVRLSPPKHASTPFRLEHLDVVRFGPHSFEVHLHWPPRECDVCAAAVSEQIDLDTAAKQHAASAASSSSSSSSSSNKGTAAVFARSASERRRLIEQERRQRLDAIKDAYGPAEKRDRGAYRDRAAVRRAMPVYSAPAPLAAHDDAPPQNVGWAAARLAVRRFQR
ncbi:hypothetical protein MCUN1_003486 [Malassezia cuniculi]|uniref:FHA domain-containing protein n=1 Tax=Malassezia cuniculi TaxID=948313 RepID=A0AAF0ET89_9BASI|nr:hypothetical protein MCUN1_003486 [Malassezia cuniculi]